MASAREVSKLAKETAEGEVSGDEELNVDVPPFTSWAGSDVSRAVTLLGEESGLLSD